MRRIGLANTCDTRCITEVGRLEHVSTILSAKHLLSPSVALLAKVPALAEGRPRVLRLHARPISTLGGMIGHLVSKAHAQI